MLPAKHEQHAARSRACARCTRERHRKRSGHVSARKRVRANRQVLHHERRDAMDRSIAAARPCARPSTAAASEHARAARTLRTPRQPPSSSSESASARAPGPATSAAKPAGHAAGSIPCRRCRDTPAAARGQRANRVVGSPSSRRSHAISQRLERRRRADEEPARQVVAGQDDEPADAQSRTSSGAVARPRRPRRTISRPIAVICSAARRRQRPQPAERPSGAAKVDERHPLGRTHVVMLTY